MRPDWFRAAQLWPVDLGSDLTLRKSFDLLQTKWGEVPFGQYERRQSSDFLRLSDDEVLEKWTAGCISSSTGSVFTELPRERDSPDWALFGAWDWAT